MPTAGHRYHQHFEYMFAFSKTAPKTFNPIVENTKYNGLANMKNRGKAGSLNYKKIDENSTKKSRQCVFLFGWGRNFYKG